MGTMGESMGTPPPDATQILRMIYERYPSPWIGGLIGD